jgi:3'-phosphoadenosine 5'-phosphosulfate sulfotransferase (PAPS reductase)/FAD synthetase
MKPDLRIMKQRAHRRLRDAIRKHVTDQGKELAGIVVLVSGGNDSTILGHLFKEQATHFGHCNTGIGIHQTRQFVRNTVQSWGKTLIEVHPPQGSSYKELVLDQGFPGPAHHYKMYQRLKERGLRDIRRQLVTSRNQRVIFLAGRRKSESHRRMLIPDEERIDSVIWVSPIYDWTDEHMRTYAQTYNVPKNEVSEMLHKSGECLCGAFAKKDEFQELAFFFPETAHEIQVLEREVQATGKFPDFRCKWGWGGDPHLLALSKQLHSKSGPLCSDCDTRMFENQQNVVSSQEH